MRRKRWLVVLLVMALALPTLPATVARAGMQEVTSLLDNGDIGTLRQVLAQALPGDAIVFRTGLTGYLRLNGTPLAFLSDVTIQGPGAASILISGENQSQVFTVASGRTVTIIGSGPSSAGGLSYYGGTLDIGNVLLTDNTAGGSNYDFQNVIGSAGVTNRGSNFIRVVVGAFPAQASDIIGNMVTVLGPLADNGGVVTLPDGTHTKTRALLPGSVPVDGGNNTLCAASPVSNVDGRGLPRPPPGKCDIGAFEVQPGVTPTTPVAAATSPAGPPAPKPPSLHPAAPTPIASTPTPLPAPMRR